MAMNEFAVRRPGQETDLQRRSFLGAGLALVAAQSVVAKLWAAAQSAPVTAPIVTIENFSAAGKSLGLAQVPKVIKTEAEWRAQLSAAAYRVARQDGTEYAFSGEYASSHADGIYHCVCCDTPLYDSHTKFESGTGWPSFWQPLARAVGERSDSTFGISRTEVHCRRCGGHLGHVFDDGPKPTGLRYCMDGLALTFRPV